MNRGLPVLDLARGRDFLVLTKRSAASGDENDSQSAAVGAEKTREPIQPEWFLSAKHLQRKFSGSHEDHYNNFCFLPINQAPSKLINSQFSAAFQERSPRW